MFKVCVVEKVCGFVVCGFLFVFFVFLEREKKSEGGGAQNSLSPSLLTESDSFFRPKKSEKTYLTNRAFTSLFCY